MAKALPKASLTAKHDKDSPSIAYLPFHNGAGDPVPDWILNHESLGPEYVNLETEFRVREAKLQIEKMEKIQELARRASAK
jgi:hypothetical protein